MQYQIINTCGTSILTNYARKKSCLELINKYSNCKDEKEIPESDYAQIENLYFGLMELWKSYDDEEVKKQSAELNSLLTWLVTKEVKKSDCFCYLLHTDTFIGGLTAHLLEDWMKNRGFQCVEIKKIDNLNTANFESFQNGLSNFAKWSFETVQSSDYQKVIFNIAGGFKSFSGFGQILGQYLADETIYKFETGDVILSIPKMPVQTNESEFRKYFDEYHKVSLCIPNVSHENLNPLWVKDGKFTPWGQIEWEKAKIVLYEEKVYPIVYDKVLEGADFRDSIGDLDKRKIKQLNERLDDLCHYKMTGEHIKRLDYKKLKFEHKGCTHECDAWADQDCKRIFCKEKNGKIIVELLVNPLH